MQNNNILFILAWHILHLILRVLYLAQEVLRTLENYLITNGLITAYVDLNLDRVKYLGVVIDSDEARKTSEVIQLLEWLSAFGVKKSVYMTAKVTMHLLFYEDFYFY